MQDLYLVSWQIEVEADSPREAAIKAQDAQQRVGTLATVFGVKNCTQKVPAVNIDLCDPPDRHIDIVYYERDVNSLGRNGDVRTQGLDILKVGANVSLSPVRKKGGTGRCFIEMPVDAIPEVVQALRDIYERQS